MKTSLDLPDELYRRVKAKSALEGRAVREVATALFTAWVGGRIPAESADTAPQGAAPTPPDPREQWIARWQELSTRVAAASPTPAGLVEQLRADRR